ncbi:hypothetical protein [Leifsonia aquatica]|uniref:hypothetical protein n=1 Tax=Leifsonia aquatica TaxID=144185 RepID=UPI00382E67D3
MFEEFTSQDSAEEWGLAAAVTIARVRRRTSEGPTFSELFSEVMPDTHGIPGPMRDGTTSNVRYAATHKFRYHIAVEWRRRGLIGWSNGVERSLRVGPAFIARSLERRRRVIRELSEALGPTLVAALSGVDRLVRQQRLVSHEVLKVRTRAWKRLEFAHDLWASMEANEGRDVARDWFLGSNARVRGETPVTAIRKDRHAEVQAAAESLIRGDVDE